MVLCPSGRVKVVPFGPSHVVWLPTVRNGRQPLRLSSLVTLRVDCSETKVYLTRRFNGVGAPRPACEAGGTERSHVPTVLAEWPTVGAGLAVASGDLLTARAVVMHVVHVRISGVAGVVRGNTHGMTPLSW